MLSRDKRFAVLLPIVAVAMAACGGGGGGATDGGAAPVAWPTDGRYAWVLKADGPTSALKYGLSLVHPRASSVEVVIEPASAAVTDAVVVSSGTVDATRQLADQLQPYALLYIVGGDVRRVPLQADGQSPATRVQRAATTSACRIVLSANDYAQPERSRYVVSTAGTDGRCDTGDDGRAEVRLDASLGLVITPLTSELPMAALRDPTTLAPRGWIGPRSATFWSPAPASTVSLRGVGAPAIDSVVSSSYRTAVVQSVGGLSLLDFPGGNVVNETPLAAATGDGWQGIGYDAGDHYVYRNTGSSPAIAWEVVKISRQTPVATRLASGPGEAVLASLGKDLIYLTVLGTGSNQLLAVDKATPAAAQVLEADGIDVLPSVTTSRTGVHQLWRVSGLAGASIGYAIEFIDEGFHKLYTVASGAFPITQIDASAVDFNASENRSRFLFATGYGNRAFGDAAMRSYDVATRTLVTLGSLPGTTAYGSDVVYANVVSGPSPQAGGFVARSTAGVLQAADAKVFSFDAATANSLQFTSTRQ